MPCQRSYAAVRAVTLAPGSTVGEQLAALQAATPGILPAGWASSLLALQPEGALTLTDPLTGVTFTCTAAQPVYGTELTRFTPGAGDVLLYFGQRDAAGGPARVIR